MPEPQALSVVLYHVSMAASMLWCCVLMLQVPDLKALMGDSSDNIPGLKGIGIKTATQLLQKHGDLDTVFEHAAEEKKGVAAKLAGRQEEAALYKNLATVRWATHLAVVIGVPCLHPLMQALTGVVAHLWLCSVSS